MEASAKYNIRHKSVRNRKAILDCATSCGDGATRRWYNGHDQRVLRENDQGQTVFVYGAAGHNVLGEYQPSTASSPRWSNGLTTEHIYLPTATGPMPVAAVIGGEHFAVHSDHLNTPRKLSDKSGQPRWQWAYSGFGEIGAQSLTTATLSEVRYNLRYPGQVDDGNGLFYNWHRFYHPGTGRYTSADPIGLQGGWNRFGYVGGNALGAVDPMGLVRITGIPGADGETSVHANPGPEATTYRPDHGPDHVHLGQNDGPSVRTSDFQPMSPEDAKRMSRKQKKFCEGLAEESKDLIRKRQSQIFKYGRVLLQVQAGGLLSISAACRADPGWCLEQIDAGVLP